MTKCSLGRQRCPVRRSLPTMPGEMPQPLGPAVQHKLLLEAQEGHNCAREAVIVHNMRLIFKQLDKIQAQYNQSFTRSDMVQAAVFGLHNAVKAWDPGKGAFSTLASLCIFRAVSRELDNCDHMIRLTVDVQTELRKAARRLNAEGNAHTGDNGNLVVRNDPTAAGTPIGKLPPHRLATYHHSLPHMDTLDLEDRDEWNANYRRAFGDPMSAKGGMAEVIEQAELKPKARQGALISKYVGSLNAPAHGEQDGCEVGDFVADSMRVQTF